MTIAPPVRRVAILVFPGFQMLDATGPAAAFEVATAHGAPYATALVAAWPGLVQSSGGMAVMAGPLPEPDAVDLVLVSGGEGTRSPRACERTGDFLRAASVRGVRIASVCTGAFLLARAGLLDGRRAATHWRWAPALAKAFPQITVEPDRIFVRDGDVWTSAGITAGIDLALALIAADAGEDLARAVAQELVVFHRRPGGQSQYSALLSLDAGGGRFDRLLVWMRERLAEPLPVERLAAEAGMSLRNFARAFAVETGATPAKAVERLRVEAARALVETAGVSVDTAAARAGFGDPERMRRAFLRAFGQPPQALRRGARVQNGDDTRSNGQGGPEPSARG